MIRRVENDSMNVELANESLVIDTPDGSVTLSIDEANGLREMLDIMFQSNQLYQLTKEYKQHNVLGGLTPTPIR